MTQTSMTPKEIDALIAEHSEAELGVELFVAKLKHVNAAGVDFGVPPEQLRELLVAINVTYEQLTTPGDGVPH